jgi:MFS family permease
MFLWSAVTWLTSYTRTFEQLLLLRALTGLAEACYYPAALALISDYHRGRTRSLATAIHQSGYILGVGLSGVGGWLAEQRSWHFAFALVGLAGVAFSIPLALLLRDAPRENSNGVAAGGVEHPPRLGAAVASLLASGSFVLMAVNMALGGVVGYTIMSWMPVFLQERFHLTQGAAGLSATGVMSAASVPGLIIGGVWADRWSRTNPRGRMFVLATGVLLSAPGILLTANSHALVVAALGLGVYRLFGAFFEANSMPVLCEVVDSRYRATGYGLLNLMASVGAGIGIYISGILRDLKIDLHLVFDTFPVILVLCGTLAFFIRARKPAAPMPVVAIALSQSGRAPQS